MEFRKVIHIIKFDSNKREAGDLRARYVGPHAIDKERQMLELAIEKTGL